jgi:hypothetical protein
MRRGGAGMLRAVVTGLRMRALCHRSLIIVRPLGDVQLERTARVSAHRHLGSSVLACWAHARLRRSVPLNPYSCTGGMTRSVQMYTPDGRANAHSCTWPASVQMYS